MVQSDHLRHKPYTSPYVSYAIYLHWYEYHYQCTAYTNAFCKAHIPLCIFIEFNEKTNSFFSDITWSN